MFQPIKANFPVRITSKAILTVSVYILVYFLPHTKTNNTHTHTQTHTHTCGNYSRYLRHCGNLFIAIVNISQLRRFVSGAQRNEFASLQLLAIPSAIALQPIEISSRIDRDVGWRVWKILNVHSQRISVYLSSAIKLFRANFNWTTNPILHDEYNKILASKAEFY